MSKTKKPKTINGDELETEINLTVFRYGKDWFNQVTTTQSSEGFDGPAGPFKTFDAAFKELTSKTALKEFAAAYKEEENL